MQRPMLNKDIRPLSEFRAGTAAFVKRVRTTKRPLVLTHRGKGVAVLIDIDEYEAVLERIDLLDEIRTAEDQIARGLGVDHETAFAQLKKKIGG